MEKQILKSFLVIFLIVHLVISYVIGSLNPFYFDEGGRLFEVILIAIVFGVYVKIKLQ